MIELSRLASRGREVGTSLGAQKATRRVPLVFVAGEGEKAAGVRGLMQDAHSCA